METYVQPVKVMLNELKDNLPPQVLEVVLDALQPRVSEASRAAENLKKYGLELPDSELLR